MCLYYLDGNTIVIRENGTVKDYIAFTDNSQLEEYL